MKLNSGDTILTAWCEHCTGPGWNYSLVNVLVISRLGTLRIETLQPGEYIAEVGALFDVSSACHEAMTRAIRRSVANVS